MPSKPQARTMLPGVTKMCERGGGIKATDGSKATHGSKATDSL